MNVGAAGCAGSEDGERRTEDGADVTEDGGGPPASGDPTLGAVGWVVALEPSGFCRRTSQPPIARTRTVAAPIPPRRRSVFNPLGLDRREICAADSPPTLGIEPSDGASPVRCFWAFLRASLIRLIGRES